MLAYAAGFVLVIYSLQRHHCIPTRPVLIAGAIALPFHLLSLHLLMHMPDGNVRFGFYNLLSLVTAVIVLLTLITSLYRPIINSTIVAYPLAALALLLSLIGDHSHAPVRPLSTGSEVHVLLSIMAYCLLTLATIQAALLSVLEKRLHLHRTKRLLGLLPPLQTMEQLLFEMMTIGVILLTLAILSGFVYLHDVFAQHLLHKTVFSLLAWSIFTTLVIGHHLFGWRGRIAVRGTLTGFVLLLLGFFGSQLVLELILHRA